MHLTLVPRSCRKILLFFYSRSMPQEGRGSYVSRLKSHHTDSEIVRVAVFEEIYLSMSIDNLLWL